MHKTLNEDKLRSNDVGEASPGILDEYAQETLNAHSCGDS